VAMAKENITIRPGKSYKGIKEALENEAKKTGRSLNNYLLYTLQLHLLKQNKNENRKNH